MSLCSAAFGLLCRRFRLISGSMVPYYYYYYFVSTIWLKCIYFVSIFLFFFIVFSGTSYFLKMINSAAPLGVCFSLAIVAHNVHATVKYDRVPSTRHARAFDPVFYHILYNRGIIFSVFSLSLLVFFFNFADRRLPLTRRGVVIDCAPVSRIIFKFDLARTTTTTTTVSLESSPAESSLTYNNAHTIIVIIIMIIKGYGQHVDSDESQ